MTRLASVERPETKTAEKKAVEEDPRYLLVQRILATPDFIRSPQLSKFLAYICGTALKESGQNLSEQHIGVEVFGREPDYDSAADTIVRSHALRLRRRLEQYFQRAGPNEPLHLIIPRGSYVPVFLPDTKQQGRERQDGDPASGRAAGGSATESAKGTPNLTSRLPHETFEVPGASSEASVAGDHHARAYTSSDDATLTPRSLVSAVWRYRFLTVFLAMLFVGLAVAFGLHLRTHFRIDRRHILWGRLFTEDQPTQIVLGDSGLVLFHAFTRQYVSLHDYLSNDYSKQMPFVAHIEPKYADFLLHRRYTSMVDATTLAHLVRLPEAIPERTLVHYSRDMHIEDFNNDNVIMVGAQEAVPWVELFETHMDFVFSIDNPDRHSSFVNRHPRAGEETEYSPNMPGNNAKVYGVVAFLPNLSGTGNVLILEGLTMVGTEAAINLAMEDDRLLPVLAKIRRSDGSLPHFEMLLESDILGEGAGPARVMAIHIHD